MSSSKLLVSPAGVFRGVRYSSLTVGNIGAKNRDTQREHSSKTLKHSIVKRISVFKRYIEAYVCPKIIGIKTHLFENFSQKKGSRKF